MTSSPRQLSRRLNLLMPALALALFSSGCLNFESQTIVLFFPKDGTEIRGLFIYEGLMVQGKPGRKSQGGDLLDAIEDLEELVRGDAVLFGERNLRVALKPRPMEVLDAKILKLYKPYLTAHNGQFLMNKAGKLTFCQPVTLRDSDKFLAGINKHVSETVLTVPLDPLDDGSRELILRFARDGKAWFRYDKGRVSLSVPGSPFFFQQVRKHMFDATSLDKILQKLNDLDKPAADVKSIVKELRQEAELAQRVLKALGQAPLSVDQRRDMVTFSLGLGENEPFQIQTPLRYDAQFPNLDKDLQMHARTLGAPVRTDVTVEDVVKEFQRTGQFPRQDKE